MPNCVALNILLTAVACCGAGLLFFTKPAKREVEPEPELSDVARPEAPLKSWTDIQISCIIEEVEKKWATDNCWVIIYSSKFQGLEDKGVRDGIIKHLFAHGYQDAYVAAPCHLDPDFVLHVKSKNGEK